MTKTASHAQTLPACLRRQHFAVLSTSDAFSVPASAGVSYGASQSDLVICVMARRNCRRHGTSHREPQVSLVVPVARRLAWFLPPATMQLRGSAELLGWTDPDATKVFQHFWPGRRILRGYRRSHRAESIASASFGSHSIRSSTPPCSERACGRTGARWSPAPTA